MANWSLDTAHSEIEFKVKHMMISTVKGQFHDFNVTVDSESEQLEQAQISVEIQAGSINTKNEQRDQHLKGADFFNVDEFPVIKFESKSIDHENGLKVTGDLTIREVTKSVTFDIEFGGLAKDPWGNNKAGYTVTGSIKRTDFGLNWNAALETGGVMVSEEVKFQADLQFVLS